MFLIFRLVRNCQLSQSNRVMVLDGHTECVSIEFEREGVTPEEVQKVLEAYLSQVPAGM